MDNIKKLFQKVFKKKRSAYVGSYSLTDIVDALSGESIQEHMLVQSCIESVADQMKKLDPRHIIKKESGEFAPVFDQINRVLQRPNVWMTTSEFIEKLVWTLLLNFNAYVLPVYSETHELLALWPIPGQQYEMIQDKEGVTWLHVTFQNGTDWTLRYDELIHLRKRFSLNEFFGGNTQGGADVKGLQKSLNLTDSAFTALTNSLQTAGKLDVVLKYDSFIEETNKQQLIKDFEKMMKDGNGVVAMGSDSSVVQLQRKSLPVTSDTMSFLEDRILRYFGISHAILSGDFNHDQKEAFYEKTIEPLCVTFSQAFSKALFTVREETSYGHRIFFYASKIDFMSNAQKIEMARILGDRGTLSENEIRSMFGLPPDPALEGVHMMSLNYINSVDAPLYQKAKHGIVDEDEPDNTTDTDKDKNDK